MKKVMIKKHVTSKKPAGTPGGNFGRGNMRHDSRTRCPIRHQKYAPLSFQTSVRLFSTKKSKRKTIQFHLSFPESTKHHPVSNVRAKPVKFISSCSPKTVLRIGLLYTNKNGGDFGANSVTKRNCAAPISKVESHISDRSIHNIYIYIPDCFWCWHEKQFGVV